MQKRIIILIILFLFVLLTVLGLKRESRVKFVHKPTDSVPAETIKKKVLFINSYHEGYEWGDSIVNGALKEFNIYRLPVSGLDISSSPVDFRIIYLDAIRNPAEEQLRSAAENARTFIENWHPDMVITSDDAAAKYVIAEHFRDHDIPFVFCGVNWEADKYGLPCSNVTGMLEVPLLRAQSQMLAKLAKGPKVGVIGSATASNIKDLEMLAHIHPDATVYLVNSFEEWKVRFLQLQDEVDYLHIEYSQDVEGWDDDLAMKFVNEHSRIPAGTGITWLMPCSVIAMVKDPVEQGEWAALRAKEILNGRPVSDIPVVENKHAKLQLNMPLAEILGVVFPAEWVEHAEIYDANDSRIMFINSWSEGHAWSDQVEAGFRKGLGILNTDSNAGRFKSSKYDVHFIRLNADWENSSADRSVHLAGAVKAVEDWQPDLIVLNDRVAVDGLVRKLAKTGTPILYCGVPRGFHAIEEPQVRGVRELVPVYGVLSRLEPYADSQSSALLGLMDELNDTALVDSFTPMLERFDEVEMVSSIEEWKASFARMQNEVGQVVLVADRDFQLDNPHELLKFVEEHIKVPTCAASYSMLPFAALGVTSVPEEQGWWCAMQVLDVLAENTKFEDVKNAESTGLLYYINPRMAFASGLIFTREDIDRSEVVSSDQ